MIFFLSLDNRNVTLGFRSFDLKPTMGNGGGSVGRAIASDTRDPWFEFCHRQNFIYQLYNQNTEKTKIKKKRLGNFEKT